MKIFHYFRLGLYSALVLTLAACSNDNSKEYCKCKCDACKECVYTKAATTSALTTAAETKSVKADQERSGTTSKRLVRQAPEPIDPTKKVLSKAQIVHSLEKIRAFANPGKGVETRAKAPYIGAIVVDANSGEVIFEDNADALAMPASTLKLMDLLLVQEDIEAGRTSPQSIVSVSKRAYETGGSQVYLDPREKFPLDDMLYALMIVSANDAAVAIAEHIEGSCEAMVERMNRRASELGLSNTRYSSVNGLPPSAGSSFDVTTPRDLAALSVELCKHPGIFKYTSEKRRQLRANTKTPFDMLTHNPLLKNGTPGCDGLKTGWTRMAGYSISTTIKRGDKRVVIVLMGCPDKKIRDAQLRILIDKAFAPALLDGASAQ